MTSRISKLVLAAVLAAAALPAAARACDHESDDRAEAAWPVPWRPDLAPPYRWGEAAWPAPWRPDPAPSYRWREAAWRERELQRVRAELQALDAERAELHARFAWNPHKLRRYDRWYFERRTELERRWHELQPVAWR